MQAALTSISSLFDARGSFLGEAVTQLEHGLQADGIDEALVAAPLLRDVSHVLHDLPDDTPDIDNDHENSAARMLADLFGPGVAEPVRPHYAKMVGACTPSLTDFEPPLSRLATRGGVPRREKDRTVNITYSSFWQMMSGPWGVALGSAQHR